MDLLTHAMSGALLARATAPRSTGPGVLPLRTRVAAGFAAALFPDVDFALRLAGTLTYLNWHQGPTHSLILLPLWAFTLAWLFSRLDRRRHGWRAFFPVACLGLAAHIVGDLVTAYGLMLFAPFATGRFALPLAFVIDPWITGILATGVLAGMLPPGHGRSAARLAFVALAGYLAILAVQREQALGVGAAWRADAPDGGGAQIHALPQPLSPLHWKVLVRGAEGDHVALVRLSGDTARWPTAVPVARLQAIASSYRPPDRAEWRYVPRFGAVPEDAAFAREAWARPAFSPFRRFAAFPALDRVEHGETTRCAWFLDQRFVLPAMPPSFRFGVCRAEIGGEWQVVRARGAFWID